MKRDMDTLAIVALIIALFLIAFAILTLIVGKWRADSASAYQRRLTVEREYDVALIQAAKVLVVGNQAYITSGVDKYNQIIYKPVTVDVVTPPLASNTIDGKRITLHQIASRLVDDSISANGADGVKLLTADQWEAMGHEHDEHKAALLYLKPLGVMKVQGGRSDAQGTFVKEGETLQTLLRDLAVYALPLSAGQRIDKS